MIFRLIRNKYCSSGIFGKLVNEEDNTIAYTLEHAYANGDVWTPKVAKGTYVCRRHQPEHLPYVTFMITNVPPFQGEEVNGILIHIGNYNEDSEGCVLLGANIMNLNVRPMLTASEATFKKFMNDLSGVDSFELCVS